MFLSNPAQSFLLILLILIAATACGLFGTGQDAPAPPVEETKSRIPFKTKEPESFQCEIVETAGDIVRRKRLAKRGSLRRVDFDPGEKTHRVLLYTDKEYVLDIGRGVYAEIPSGTGGQFGDLTQELLNTGGHADFAETSREGNIVRYTVKPDGADLSEIAIVYDEAIGLPVKQEFFSIENGERTLQFTVEMIGFTVEPDADVFAIPGEFRKISMEEMSRTTNK